MDLNLVSLFVTAAQAKSFADAADKLDVPRSSVSRGIAALEQSLGLQLFHRTTRHVTLTSDGAALYTQIAPHVTAMTRALGSVSEREQEPSGELRITAPIDIGGIVLPQILAAFSLRFRDIRLDVRLSNRNVDIVGEGFDGALRLAVGRLPDSSLVARRLTGLDIHIYAAPAYLARAGMPRTLREASDHEWVAFRGAKPLPPFPMPKLAPRLVGDDVHFITQAVVAGGGLALLPTYLAREHVDAGRLVRVLPRHEAGSGALYFVHASARHVPRKVAALRDFLVDHFAAHPLR